MEYTQIERFANKSIRTRFICFHAIFFLIFSSQKNDRDMACIKVSFHVTAEFKPIHFRHHHIWYYQVHIFVSNDLDPLFTITSCIYIIISFQQLSHHHQQVLIVFYQKQCAPFFLCLSLFFFLHHFHGNVLCYGQYIRFIIDILLLICTAINRNNHLKRRTLSQFTLYGDSSLMQFHQIFCQRQSDASAYGIEFPVITFIKTLKQCFLSLFRNTFSVIFHYQHSRIQCFFITQIDPHRSFFFVIFRWIGQQII